MTVVFNAITTIHDLHRRLRQELAGVFATTPLELFIRLGGETRHFNAEAEARMIWHLRSCGYAERDVTPACSFPARTAWVRRVRWPEDKAWIAGDLSAILDQVESFCD